MKYKVGDKVTIKKELEIGGEYGTCGFVEDMEYLLGKIATIKEVDEEDSSYKLKEDIDSWYWTDEMFEEVVDEFEVIVDAYTIKKNNLSVMVFTDAVAIEYDEIALKDLDDLISILQEIKNRIK